VLLFSREFNKRSLVYQKLQVQVTDHSNLEAFFSVMMQLSSKLGGTAEGLPARSLTALESSPLRYLAGAEARTDGEEP